MRFPRWIVLLLCISCTPERTKPAEPAESGAPSEPAASASAPSASTSASPSAAASAFEVPKSAKGAFMLARELYEFVIARKTGMLIDEDDPPCGSDCDCLAKQKITTDALCKLEGEKAQRCVESRERVKAAEKRWGGDC